MDYTLPTKTRFRYSEIWRIESGVRTVHWRACDGYEIELWEEHWTVWCRGVCVAVYDSISGCTLGEA